MSTAPTTTTATYGTLPTTITTTTTTTTPSYSTFITHPTPTTTPTSTTSYHHHLLRPWTEFLSLTTLSLPTTYSTATARLRRNAAYFRSNYTLLLLIALFLSLLFHPVSMLVFLLVFIFWLLLYFSRSAPLVVLGRPVDDRIVLFLLGLVTVVTLVFTHVGVNVLVSLVVGVAVVGFHAVVRSVDDLFLDDVIEGGGDGTGLVEGEGQPLRPTYGRVV